MVETNFIDKDGSKTGKQSDPILVKEYQKLQFQII